MEITKTLQNYLPIANITEYNPTKEYHPATKKYVDDKFICTDIVDNVGTISKEEMQKCNNGTSRYVSSINLKEFFADYEHYIYQGIYGDKKVHMKYDKDYNRMIAYDLTDVIELGFEFNNNYMYPFNAGTDEVKAYQFTNDLVITKSPVLNPSEVLPKNNTQEYTPTTDYNPATKKYVDDKIKDTLVTTNISGTTLSLTTDKYQTVTVVDGTEITLPTVTSFTEIHLFFSTTTDLTLTLPTCKWQNGNTPTISANKTYEFIFTYTTEWLGGVIVYE